MKHIRKSALISLTVALAVALMGAMAACSSDDEQPQPEPRPTTESSPTPTDETADPEPDAGMPEDSPEQLWTLINDEDYTSWPTAPAYDQRQPAAGPHGDEVQVFMNDVAAKRMATKETGGLPAGSIVVKDVYRNGGLEAVAVMQKTSALKWYWAEYDADGGVIAEGLETPVCADCHSEGKDFVRSFEVP